VAFEKGVPMGEDLQARPAKAKAPTFVIRAEKDPDAANLDRSSKAGPSTTRVRRLTISTSDSNHTPREL
jgi:hypothetical protein